MSDIKTCPSCGGTGSNGAIDGIPNPCAGCGGSGTINR